MHSKLLVIFFLSLCALSGLSSLSLKSFEEGESSENETLLIEATSLLSDPLIDENDESENTTDITDELETTTKTPTTLSQIQTSEQITHIQTLEQTSTHEETPEQTSTFEQTPELKITHEQTPEQTITHEQTLEQATTHKQTSEQTLEQATTHKQTSEQTSSHEQTPEHADPTNPPELHKLDKTPSKSPTHETSTQPMTRPRRDPPRIYGAKKHGSAKSSALFDMCPPLEETCPACSSVMQNDLSQYLCHYPVALKVLLLSPPETDLSGRMCGKLGKLAVHGTVESKQFRSLIRFSIKDTCGCSLRVSQHYFLFTNTSEFIKQGRVYSKVSLSEKSLLIPVDQYTEREILKVLIRCSVEEMENIPDTDPLYNPYQVPSVSETPFDPLQQEDPFSESSQRVSARSAQNRFEPKRFFPPPMAFTPFPPLTFPPIQPMAPFVPFSPLPPMIPQTQSQEPPIYIPPIVYNQPQTIMHKSTAYAATNGGQVSVQTDQQYSPINLAADRPTVISSSGTGYSASSSIVSGQPQPTYLFQTSYTNCLYSPSTCPSCSSYNASKFGEEYCNANYAFLSTVTFPDRSLRQSESINENTCWNLRAQLLHDISKEVGRKILFQSLSLLLPHNCNCLTNQKDPAVILLLGKNNQQPTSPQTQLSSDHILTLVSAPSDTPLPVCRRYQAPSLQEEVKPAVYSQPEVQYVSEIPMSSVPEIVEYASEIPPSSDNPSASESKFNYPVQPVNVPVADVQMPPYKPENYQEPAYSQTASSASEPQVTYEQMAPEPPQIATNPVS